jgi:hypothetical protein
MFESAHHALQSALEKETLVTMEEQGELFVTNPNPLIQIGPDNSAYN